MNAQLLLVAKAPIAGLAKTRLGRDLGMADAADLAAAALLDTIDACAAAFPGRCHVAMTGDLAEALRSKEIRQALAPWHLFEQQGDSFAERLAHAHTTVAERAGGPVVQIGMDTPQVGVTELSAATDALAAGARGVIGPAADGGWWLLGLAEPTAASALVSVPMSRGDTGALTTAALRPVTGELTALATLRDVDTVADAAAVAALAPHGRFACAWAAIAQESS